MTTLQLTICILLASAPSAIAVSAHETSPSNPEAFAPPPPPLHGVFSKALLNEFLKPSSCTEIRFYTAQRTTDPATVSVIAIGVDKNGKEIDDFLHFTPYRMYDGLDDKIIKVSKMNASKASTACKNYTSSGSKCFAASLSRADLVALLSTACDGLELTLTKRGEHTIFQVTAVVVVGGKTVPLGSGATYVRLSTDPCPPVCGEDPRPSYYLKMK